MQSVAPSLGEAAVDTSARPVVPPRQTRLSCHTGAWSPGRGPVWRMDIPLNRAPRTRREGDASFRRALTRLPVVCEDAPMRTGSRSTPSV
jgi:hypothetical protein